MSKQGRKQNEDDAAASGQPAPDSPGEPSAENIPAWLVWGSVAILLAVVLVSVSYFLVQSEQPSGGPAPPRPTDAMPPFAASELPQDPSESERRASPEPAAPEYLNRALLLGRQGKHDEALEVLRQAVKDNPLDNVARLHLAAILEQLGKPAESLEQFQEAVRVEPESATAQANLAMAWMRRGDDAQAIAHFDEALRVRPDFALVHVEMAKLLSTHADPKIRSGAKAVQHAEQAARTMGANDPGMLDVLAAAYAEAGRFEEAVAAAQKALELARSQAMPELAIEIESRLRLYQDGRPNHATPKPN